MNEKKLFNVYIQVSWMNGGRVCSAEIHMSGMATSTGMAIAHAITDLQSRANFDIMDVQAGEAE